VSDAFDRFGLGDEDRAAWAASGRDDFDGWLLDRVARRPAGARARAVYGAEDVHDFARRAILAALALGPDDALLEIGCGGGLLLRDATAGRVVGLDHSAEMVALARENAPRATVVEGDAAALPFGDGEFTAVAMSVVFMFLPDPGAVLDDCRRVLAPRGRLAVFTTSAELRGTPAAPEPFASLSRFYTDAELADLAIAAGFGDPAVRNDRGGQLLTARA
jgi:ubiquinone/menaquinone biosynthesis C-methylase UbiE